MDTFLRIALLMAALALSNSAHAKTILIFGDSLSAGYGIARNDSWGNLLQTSLQKTHPLYEVVNASISGETTSGGVRRIGKALNEHHPAVVILELGANDALRGTPLSETEKNLNGIILQAKKANAKVLLLGIQIPPNYGLDYTKRFSALYPKLAKKHKVSLVSFMLKDIPPEQFQADNLHPNAVAQPQILKNVLPNLTPLLIAK
ncbi:MAG: arylesterase [Sideroxydans sp.]|nr:arylesterase [Sideroxydans sp.]